MSEITDLRQDRDMWFSTAHYLAGALSYATGEPADDLIANAQKASVSCPWGSRGTVDCAEFGPRECDGIRCGDAT